MKHEVYLEYSPYERRSDGSVIPLDINEMTIKAVTCSCGKRMTVMPDITREQAIALGTRHIAAASELELLGEGVAHYLGVFMSEQDAQDCVLLYHDMMIPFVHGLGGDVLGAFRAIAKEIGLTSYVAPDESATLDHEATNTDQEESNGT